jgi:hypothetical protein
MKNAIIFIILLCISTVSFAAEEKVIIPNEGWFITFDSPPLSKKQESRIEKGYAFRGSSGRFNISLYVEKPQSYGAMNKDCFEFYWPKASKDPSIPKNTIKISETSKYVRGQYDVVMEYKGKTIRHRNVNYYFVFNDKWVDVHISIIEPNEKDAEIFAMFDRSLGYVKME